MERTRLSRDKLQELLQYPENFFEAIVNGAFARVVDKKCLYQMVTIVRVDKTAQAYQIGRSISKSATQIKSESDGIKVTHSQTNKVLICMQGKIERPIRLDRFSNGSFTEDEFTRWKLARQKAGMKMLTKAEVTLR